MSHAENYRRCARCRYYKAFYKRGACAFYRERSGYCEKNEKAVGAKESCGLHKYRQQQNKIVILEYLEQIMKEVKEIELILGDWNA